MRVSSVGPLGMHASARFAGKSQQAKSKPVSHWSVPLLLASTVLGPMAGTLPAQGPLAAAQQVRSANDVLLENQKKIEALTRDLEAQKAQIDQIQTTLARIEKEFGFAQFAKLKQEAITRAQDATFVMNLVETKVEGKTTYMSIGSTISGMVVRDNAGTPVLLTAYAPLQAKLKSNPNTKFKVVLEPVAGEGEAAKKRFEFETGFATGLPGGLKAFSPQFDLAMLEMPKDAEALARLKSVALPLENYLGKHIPAGVETLAIGRPFSQPRYATQGIVSDHDHDGTRKNGNVSKQFPKLWTDAGISNGSEGGPLLGFNWDKKQWDVVGMVSSGTNEVMNYAVPVDVMQAFLQKRGYPMADAQDPAQMKIVEDFDKLDKSFGK